MGNQLSMFPNLEILNNSIKKENNVPSIENKEEVDDIKKNEVAELQRQINSLKKENNNLHARNNILKDNNSELSDRNIKLLSELNDTKFKINNLKEINHEMMTNNQNLKFKIRNIVIKHNMNKNPFPPLGDKRHYSVS